jgi:glycosyltransferase involved in cell wall biosynthesis
MRISDDTNAPLVSIGLAVYNGEDFLEEAIDSILTQTITNFELILSDNASTDRTEEICRRYAAQDSRVRYVRNEKNIGGANNENQTFRLSRGKYFRWAADDDVCAPDLLEKCIAVLEMHPEVVLCYSGIIIINEHGTETERIMPDKALAPRPTDRMFDLYMLTHNCETTYGLIRSDVIRKTELQVNYTDSDRTFLVELSLYGPYFQIPEYLFYKRYHPGMSTAQYSNWRERMAWFFPEDPNRLDFPHWSQFFHYLRIITRAPLSIGERLRAYGLMIYWVSRYRRWWEMLKDLPKVPKKFMLRKSLSRGE